MLLIGARGEYTTTSVLRIYETKIIVSTVSQNLNAELLIANQSRFIQKFHTFHNSKRLKQVIYLYFCLLLQKMNDTQATPKNKANNSNNNHDETFC